MAVLDLVSLATAAGWSTLAMAVRFAGGVHGRKRLTVPVRSCGQHLTPLWPAPLMWSGSRLGGHVPNLTAGNAGKIAHVVDLDDTPADAAP